jgi:outer membrane protein assembly factor BamA
MRFVFLLCFWGYCTGAIAQEAYVVVDNIVIQGHKRTQTPVVLRELPFRVGDTILQSELKAKLELGKQQVLNTGMFREGYIYQEPHPLEANRIRITLQLHESWYIYPTPYFELADRNFNVWWVDQNRSLDRIIYGMDFVHRNFSGNRDRFQIKFTDGYTRNYVLSYRLPYLNRKKTFGIDASLSFAQNREINYATKDNRQQFFRNEDQFAYQRFRSRFALTYRPKLLEQHELRLNYQQNRISEQVSQELNPNFFLSGRSLQRFFSLSYSYKFDSRDCQPYPLKGEYFTATLTKDGLGLVSNDRSALTLSSRYGKFTPLGPRWNFSFIGRSKFSFIRTPQPYNDNRAIGFSDDMIGYEYYVIDGLDMGILNTSFRWKIAENRLCFGKFIPVERMRELPFKLYLAFNNDFGYVNHPFDFGVNSFTNRMLWGKGIGLDAVFFFDKVFKIEYSFNHLWESGLFFHFNMNI